MATTLPPFLARPLRIPRAGRPAPLVLAGHPRRRAAAATAMRRVAAAVPRPVVDDGDRPINSEAGTPGRAPASTTTTHRGGPSGCKS